MLSEESWTLQSIPSGNDLCDACDTNYTIPSLDWLPWFWNFSFVPLKADPQASACFCEFIMKMIFHSCPLRMLGQMTMLWGHEVVKNTGIQINLGVRADSPSHFCSWQMTMVTLLQHYVRWQPHILTYTVYCSVKNLPLTPVETSHNGLYPRIFWLFTSCHFFFTSLFWDKIKVVLFRQGFLLSLFMAEWCLPWRGGVFCPCI